jgi:hypothetical protein
VVEQQLLVWGLSACHLFTPNWVTFVRYRLKRIDYKN